MASISFAFRTCMVEIRGPRVILPFKLKGTIALVGG